jgi:hypothetical protein
MLPLVDATIIVLPDLLGRGDIGSRITSSFFSILTSIALICLLLELEFQAQLTGLFAGSIPVELI